MRTVVTIGKFDGLHKGHALLIDKTVELAGELGLKSILITFKPHPVYLFSGGKFCSLLTDDEKEDILKKTKLNKAVFYPFDENLVKMQPECFVKNILLDEFHCDVLVIGENFRFGYKQSGNAALAQSLGIKTVALPFEQLNGEKISSEKIRQFIEKQDFDGAAELLGYRYFVSGIVEHGKKLGRTLGFPTVNLIPDVQKLLPPNGVYTSKTYYNNNALYGITNIGTNPTVGGKHKTMETYLFDFNKNIYGKALKIEFYKKIRDEIKFSSVDELKEQIGRDKETAKLLR